MKKFNRILINYFNKAHPYLSRIFLRSNFIKELLTDLEERIPGKIITERIVAKRIYGKQPVSSIRFENQPFQKAFQTAARSNLWVDSISFKIIENPEEASRDADKKINLRGYVSRKGILKTSGGAFRPFSELIEKVGKQGIHEKDIFSDRARVKENDYKSNPITLEFDEEVFNEESDLKQFVSETLKRRSFSSVTVSHLNPYLEASFIDHKDGSSYDIWITDTKEIVIVPQLRATFASLYGLVSHIFKNFREGKIRNGD